MAEQALYNNPNEPQFPFEAVRSHLSWLPAFLSEKIVFPPEDLEPFLSTILVFGRARTATFQHQPWWKDISILAKQLNSILRKVNQQRHEIELVRRGAGFFVTCSRSPRFIWKACLTHREVGRNLDFFAPGHVYPHEPSLAVHFVETSLGEIIMAEVVLVNPLKNSTVRKEFERFNSQREALYNDTMEKLGLSYRFKCFVTYRPDIEMSIPRSLAETEPPSSDWWNENWFYVNAWFVPEAIVESTFTFCGPRTQHEPYWPLLQLMFAFVKKYRRPEFWYTSEQTGVSFWETLEGVCRKVKFEGEKDRDGEEVKGLVEQIRSVLGHLADQAENPQKSPFQGKIPSKSRIQQAKPAPRWKRQLDQTAIRYTWCRQMILIHLLERHKRNNRLCYQGSPNAVSPAADEAAFRSLC